MILNNIGLFHQTVTWLIMYGKTNVTIAHGMMTANWKMISKVPQADGIMNKLLNLVGIKKKNYWKAT